ncbi:MAG: hypothetical protein IJT84_05485 [Clostridia bacterium]|nr:hypothetical protein [Clostridia bacterium]
MKRRIFSILLCVSLVITTLTIQHSAVADTSVWDGSVSASLSGSGTFDDPYLIKSGSDLAFLAKQVNSGTDYSGKFISMQNDIILNDNSDNYENWHTEAPENVWTPIGTVGKYFRGIFDGKGYSIYGLYANGGTATQTGTGLFGATHNNKITNLHIKNSYVRSQYYVGGMVGYSQQTTFKHCSFEGYVYSPNTNNYYGAAGGFIGNANQGNLIDQCFTGGTVDAYSRSAGLIGSAPGAGTNTITDSYSAMTVTGLGAKDAPGAGTGGLVGLLQNGSVKITNSFFAGSYPSDSALRGPMVAHMASSTATVTNCYYLADAADSKNGTYGTNKTAAEFKNGTVLNLLNTDPENELFVQGENYPVFDLKDPNEPEKPKFEALKSELFTDWVTLAAPGFESGSGKATDPYIIKTAEQLAKISADVAAGEKFSGKYFKIENDIVLNTNTDYNNWRKLFDAELYRWTPIGNAGNVFNGTIDGSGHTITGMYVNKTLLYGKVDYPETDDMYVGFIGNGYGKISNLHFENCYVCGNRYVGGIAGNYGGTITNCSYQGYVRSTNDVNYSGHIGGLVGGVNVSININECFTTGRINALSRAGGLIGAIYSGGNSSITYSYSEMTFDKYIANDGVTETKSGIAGIVGFAQLGTLSIQTSFYYGNLGVTTSLSGPVTGHVANGAKITNLGNVYYLQGNTTDSVGSALSAANFKKKGFLTYFKDANGITRATLDTSVDLHPMLFRVYQKVIDKTFVDYTFNNHPGTVEEYNSKPTTYRNDGFAKNTDAELGEYVGSALLNYGCWSNSKQFTPDEKYANGEGYGVGYTAYLGGMFATVPVADIDPELFYTFSVDAKVIDVEPDVTVQIGIFRNNVDSGNLAFRDENSNTYDTAIKVIKVKLDKLTDYKTYTVKISGAEILEFCEEYGYFPTRIYFGIYSPQFILSSRYANKFGMAADNFKASQSEIPEGYVPMSNIVATDILESSCADTYGEHLYNVVENPSFENALSGVWSNMPTGFTVKTAGSGNAIFGEKYLSGSANSKMSVPINLIKNKFYTFGISIRGAVGSSYRVYISDTPSGDSLADIDDDSLKLEISGRGTGSITRKGIYFRNTMKTGTTLYVVFEVSSGTVDFDEITLTNKTAWENNKNYYEKKKEKSVTVFDASTGNEKEIKIPENKSVYEIVG